jgi:hypothetical protein
MDSIEEILNEIHRECFEDYVGLWTIPWHFREIYGINDEVVRRIESFKVLERLLEFPDIGVGQFNESGSFDFWNLPVSEVLKKLASEWDGLGHEPNIGDIAWFTAKK